MKTYHFKTFVGALILAPSVSWAASYYVSTSGADTNTGTTLTTPFRTIQKAMNAARAGDIVYVRGGVYREKIETTIGGAAGSPIRVQNYNGETAYIKGSDVVTGWVQHSGSIWKRSGWPSQAQQVFVDFNDANPTVGPKPLKQIGMPSGYYSSWEYPTPLGSGLSSMTAGTFYHDQASATLYVWLADGSSPNNHTMEVSVRSRLFFMRHPYIAIDGLKFRHTNSSAATQQGAAVELSSNSSITRCDIQFVDFAAVSMGYLQSNTSVTNCNLSNNGNQGVNAPASYNFRVAGNILNNNNYRNFNLLWHAGGFKGASKAYGVVESNIVGNNNGSGIWFDYANSGSQIIIRNNFIYNSGPKDSGIFFEVSKNALIYNNIIVNTSRRGIYCSACDNTKIFNNTLSGISGYATIEVGGMPRDGATLTNNQVMNNIITNSTTQYDLLIIKSNGTSIVNNTSNYNNIYRGGGSLKLHTGAATYYDLASWKSGTGMDTNSMSVEPMLTAPTSSTVVAANYRIQSGSPMIAKGTNLSSTVNHDYSGTPRPSGAFTLGAFEPGSSGGSSIPTATVTPTPTPTPVPATPTPNPTPAPTQSPTPAPVPTEVTSAPGTMVPPATRIVDNGGNIWTISNGVVFKNGATAGYTANVMKLYWNGTNVYQSIDSGAWWYWNGTSWISTSSPIQVTAPTSGTTTSPTPSPTPTPTSGKKSRPRIGGSNSNR